MNERVVSGWVTVAAAGAAAVCLWAWLREPGPTDLALREPGMDGRPPVSAVDTPMRVDLAGTFRSFTGTPSSLSGSWPRFRGPHADNVSREPVRLAERWAEGGPPVLWSLELGEGHAGPAVRAGRVYLLDYDEQERADALRCFSLDDGGEIWRRSYKVEIKRNHGMSRTTPAVTDRFVVSIGPKCHVLCVDAVSGDFLWGLDLVADFGSEIPLWYTAQCPLIDDGVAVLAPCGPDLLIGVRCDTGEVVWRVPNLRGWRMSHSSVIPMTLCGRNMYIYCAVGGIAAVAADGPDRGAMLWESVEWNKAVMAPSPVLLDGDRVFVTAGYGGGSMMLQVLEEEGHFRAEPLFRLEKTVFSCEQQTPVLFEGHLFGVLPKDAGPINSEFACLSPEGRLVWTSGKTKRFGLGPYLVADGKMFVLRDDGELALLRASVAGYAELARARVLHGRDAWAPMALVDGRLLLRDSKRMLCLDVRESR